MTTAKALEIPTAPRAHPALGHLLPLLREPYEFVASLPDYGDLVKIRVGPFPMIVVCDPELIHHVLQDDRTFDKGGPFYARAREVMGDGLATCPRSGHRRQRRLVQQAFHPARLPGYAEAMTASIMEVTRSWRDGRPLDISTEMMKITSRTLATTMFSDTLPGEQLDRLTENVHVIFDGFMRRMLMVAPLDRIPTRGNRAFWRARSGLHHALDRLIADRRASGTDHGDLLSSLILAHDDDTDGHGLTDTELSNTLVTLFLGGTESVATTLAWALYLLARHPRILQRLDTEVDTVLAGRPATYADLPRLELTCRVLTETLRLYPPGWFLTRTVTAPVRLGNHLLPAGTAVAYSTYLVHHRSDLYDDPESFDPDRSAPPSRHALFPFGAGARKCVGDTFAMTEATLALATIAARWHLELLHRREVRPTLSVALRPRHLRMRPVSRESAGIA